MLADDHPLVLNGLQQLFAMQPYMNVMACFTDGEQALQAVMHYQPDILIMDLKMPRKNGLAVLRELQKEKMLKRETGIQHITQILTPPRDQARQADSRWLQQQTNCRKALHHRRHRKSAFA